MSSSSFVSQIISQSQQKQGVVLLQLFDVVKQAEVAQGKPLANIMNVPNFDKYA